MAGFINRTGGIKFAPGEGPAAKKPAAALTVSSVAAAAELQRQREAANRFRATQTQASSSTSSGGNNGGGSPVGGSSTPITFAPVAASPVVDPPAPTPPAPQQDVVVTPVPVVRSAPIDTVEFVDERFSDELIIDLLFENVGGQELLTIARNDTVNGQDVVYQPFKNLGILQEIYNPTTLLRLQQTSDKFFSNFTINLRDKIPNVGSGENGKNYKLDLATGEGIIEFINIRPDEQVEVQILSAGIIEDIDLIESTES